MNLEEKETIAYERNQIPVLNLLADVCSLQKILDEICRLVKRGKGGYLCVSTVHMVMESYDNSEFATTVNNADFVVTDGMPLVWIQKLNGIKGANRVRGNDLMIAICELAEKSGSKVGFYGGSEDTIAEVLRRAEKDFPKLEVAFAYSPPFRAVTDEEDKEIVENIKNAGAQILFVGLGCPKQENWMAEHKENLPSVMVGVGAAFDFYAGNIKEPPKWIGKLGLEWLFRLVQEPGRLWRRYLIQNTRFIWLATLQLLGAKRFKD